MAVVIPVLGGLLVVSEVLEKGEKIGLGGFSKFGYCSFAWCDDFFLAYGAEIQLLMHNQLF